MRSSLVRRSCLALAVVLSAASLASATIFTVTTTSDSGAGSLRAAVVSANAVPGPHTIAFNIPGSGPHSIALATDLPTIVISGGLTIDGTTQPGYTNAPLIEIHRDDTNATCFNFAFTPRDRQGPRHQPLRHRDQQQQRRRSDSPRLAHRNRPFGHGRARERV